MLTRGEKVKSNLFLLLLSFYSLLETLIMFLSLFFDYFNILSRKIGFTCISCVEIGPQRDGDEVTSCILLLFQTR